MTIKNTLNKPEQGKKPNQNQAILGIKKEVTSGVTSALKNKNQSQILFEKIYTHRQITHSRLHEEHIINMRLPIPSLEYGSQIGFQDKNEYFMIVLKVIRAIFKRKFNLYVTCDINSFLSGHCEEIITSEEGLPNRKIILKYDKNGGYIEITGKESNGGGIGQIATHVNNGDYHEKGVKILDIRKRSEGTEGIDIYGKRIHQFIGCGSGINIKESPIKVWYTSEHDGFIKIKEINRNDMNIPNYIHISNNFEVGDFNKKMLDRKIEIYNINIKVKEEIGDGVYVKVRGNIKCKIMNYPEKIISTGGYISVLKEIRGGTIVGPFVSLRSGHHATSLFGNNNITTNVVDLSHTSIRGGNTVINIGKDLFEKKNEIIKGITTAENEIKEQEKEFKKSITSMLLDLENDYLAESAGKKISETKKQILESLLFKIKGFLSPFKIQEIYDVLKNDLYQKHECDFIWPYLLRYKTLFKIHSLNISSKKKKKKKEMELLMINEKLNTSLFVNIEGKIIGDSSGIIINYGVKNKSIEITKEGAIKMHMKYNSETDEFEDISEEILMGKLEKIQKELPGVLR